MDKEAITTNRAPAAIGPYSQAIVANGFVFLSGQIPLLPDGLSVEGDISVQTKQCLENIRAILSERNLDINHIVKITIFVRNMGDFEAINKVYSEFFRGTIFPARSLIQAAALPKGAPIEIEAIAAQ